MPEFAEHFREGTTLRYPIFDDAGLMLLNAGAPLTPRLVSLLERRGIQLVLTANLVVREGGDAGTEIPLAKPRLKVGRHPSCDIRPHARTVSAVHCEFHKLPLSIYLKDRNSTNGTFVNGQRVQGSTLLRDGDRVRFGETVVEVRIYAALAGDEGQVQHVAGLILADKNGCAGEPPLDDTMVLPEEGFKVARKLRESWEAHKDSAGPWKPFDS